MHKKLASRLKYMGEYAAATVLPWFSVYISAHIQALHQTPLALSLVLIAFLARTVRVGPAILAPISTAFFFHYLVIMPQHGWALTSSEVIRIGVILGLGFLITYFFHGLRETGRSLRLANAALTERTNALVRAQQGSNCAAWSFDATTRRTRWYEGGAELFGRSLDELTKAGSPLNFVAEEDRSRVASAAERTIRSGEPFQVEFRAVWPNGEIRWLEARGIPEGSNPTLWQGVTIDITNRKTAELALIRSEKLAAAVRLASSVSHEINNPLEALTNLVYLAKSKVIDPEAQAYLEGAEKELERLSHLTKQALRFHRQQALPTQISISELIRSLLHLYQGRILEANIRVALEENSVPLLFCPADEMKQAFGHVIQNALEAMPDGGALRVRIRMGIDWGRGDRGLRITIANSGIGMSPQTKKRIYEPFFTTKEGTNTGLGLWVTAGIIDRNGGNIRVWSVLEGVLSGTAFSVFLPLRTQERLD